MKPSWTVLLIAAWLVAPAVIYAQERDAPRRGGHQRAGADRSQPPSRQDALIERLRSELDLDEEQLVEFDRLAAEYRNSTVGNVRPDEQRELVEEMHKARREGDQARVEEIRKQLDELRGPNPADAFCKQLEEVLRDDQKEKLAKIRERMAARGGRDRQQPLAQLRPLKDRLELSEEQAQQYDELFAELRSKLKPGRARPEDADPEFLERLRKAVNSGDEERIRELSEELRASRSDPQAESDQALAEFFEAVEQILEPEQVRTLRDFREEMESNGRHGRADLRDCFRYVTRLGLDQDQRAALREIREEAQVAEREARRDREELARVTAKYQERLRDILTDEQVAKFDRWLESQQSDRRGRGDRDHRPPRGERGPRAGGDRP